MIGVNELDGPIGLFRKMYGWGEPEIRGDLWDGARLASFVGSPGRAGSPRGKRLADAEAREVRPVPVCVPDRGYRLGRSGESLCTRAEAELVRGCCTVLGDASEGARYDDRAVGR